MTLKILIYNCAQVNAQFEADNLSESTSYFRFLNATIISINHLVGYIRCVYKIQWYE